MGRRIVLVEGNNDKHVMMHICGNRGVPHLDDVRPHHNVEGLAWQKEPGLPLGASISARFLDANVSQVDVLVACLKRLFFAEQIAALATA